MEQRPPIISPNTGPISPWKVFKWRNQFILVDLPNAQAYIVEWVHCFPNEVLIDVEQLETGQHGQIPFSYQTSVAKGLGIQERRP